MPGKDRAPFEHLQPATRVQFGLGAVLPHSNTPARNASRSDAGGPSLRVTGFDDEDDDEDEYEASGERGVIIFHLPRPREEAYRGEFL